MSYEYIALQVSNGLQEPLSVRRVPSSDYDDSQGQSRLNQKSKFRAQVWLWYGCSVLWRVMMSLLGMMLMRAVKMNWWGVHPCHHAEEPASVGPSGMQGWVSGIVRLCLFLGPFSNQFARERNPSLPDSTPTGIISPPSCLPQGPCYLRWDPPTMPYTAAAAGVLFLCFL